MIELARSEKLLIASIVNSYTITLTKVIWINLKIY